MEADPTAPANQTRNSGARDHPSRGLVVLRVFLSLAFIAVITFTCFRLVHVNPATVGFAYLVGVLLIATTSGLLEATLASVVAMLCLNYFFLPPVGTFTVADPQNWVALFAFLATSITASQLSARAKRRTRQAIARQQEMERLYALSRAILLTDPARPIAKQIAHEIARTFDFPGVAIFDRGTGEIYRGGPEDIPEIDKRLRETATLGIQLQAGEPPVVVTAIRLGGEPIGSLAIQGSLLSDAALQSISNLVAVGLERARAQEAANLAKAARESEELKSTLLDAIAHDFKTPLTSIKAAAGALLADPAHQSNGQRELATIVDQESDRLARLVNEAIQMARIEGGKLQLNKGLHSASSLISSTLQEVKPLTESREVGVQLAESLPFLFVDAELVRLALRQVVDNALKYSNPATPILISVQADKDRVTLTVKDQGPGIAQEDQTRVFEKLYRSRNARDLMTGTGMGLTIARDILRAHGGDIGLSSSPGQGSEFSMFLPAASAEEADKFRSGF